MKDLHQGKNRLVFGGKLFIMGPLLLLTKLPCLSPSKAILYQLSTFKGMFLPRGINRPVGILGALKPGLAY